MRISATTHCPACQQPTVKWNHPDVLPPVGSWLVIEYAAELLNVRRTGHIESRSDEIEYETKDGQRIKGKFRWRYI